MFSWVSVSFDELSPAQPRDGPRGPQGSENGSIAVWRLTPSNALVCEEVQPDSAPSDPLCANEHKTTNLGVGSSNLSGLVEEIK